MNKTYLMVGILVFAFLAFGIYGVVNAQTPNSALEATAVPEEESPDWGPGSAFCWANAENGVCPQNREEGDHPMHTAMLEALASASGLTTEEIETRYAAGETLYQIAASQGLSDAEIDDLLTQSRAQALQQAVESGWLSQEQADWMSERMASHQGGGWRFNPADTAGSFGPGQGCSGGRGMRGWFVQPED